MNFNFLTNSTATFCLPFVVFVPVLYDAAALIDFFNFFLGISFPGSEASPKLHDAEDVSGGGGGCLTIEAADSLLIELTRLSSSAGTSARPLT